MPSISPRWSQGTVSRQAHRDLPEGTFEREVGREGFDGPSTQFYHARPPTDWSRFNGSLRPRAWNLTGTPKSENLFDVKPILQSSYTTIRFWQLDESTEDLHRNSDGDMLWFVHQGRSEFFCDYGHLDLSPGDYVVIPKGTMWRVETHEPLQILVVEALGQRIRLPDRGLLGHQALFDPAQLDIPQLDAKFQNQVDRGFIVNVKRQGEQSSIEYSYNPLDAIGWIGDLAPVRLNVQDLLPVTSHRYHLPPSVHATFECDRMMISTFVPRPFETDETALKIPFFHSNEDVDEVIFYHAGEFFSRDGIQPGSLTFHPAGFTHGPQAQAQQSMFEQKQERTNEYAVMIDAFDPLRVISEVGSKSTSEIDSAVYANGDLELEDYATRWAR